MDQSKLNPQEQATLFELLKKSGTQPTSGGLSPDAAPEMPAPGSFADNPEGAMEAISKLMMSKATGPQLVDMGNGQMGERAPVDQPLLRLFGMKKTVPVTSPDYYSAAKEAGLEQFLPSNLPRTPAGTPFVGDKALDNARQLQSATKESGKRLLSPEESKLTIEYWKEAAPSLVPMAQKILETSGGLPEWLGKAGPSYRLKRSEFNSVQGFTEDGKPVEYDATSKEWFVGGEKTHAKDIGRLLSKTRPQMSTEQVNEVTNLLNAQNQLKEVEQLFDPKAIGPVQDRLLSFQEYTGIKLPDLHGMSVLTDDKVKLRTVMGGAINDYIKAITGAQMSEPEARRIMKALPKPGSADEAFLPALEMVAKITKQKLNTRLDVLETQDTVGVKKLRELATSPVNPATGEAPKPPAKKKPLGEIFKTK